MALLQQHAFEALPDTLVQRQVSEEVLRVGDRQQLRQFAARLDHRDRTRRRRVAALLDPQSVDKVSQILGEPVLSLPRRTGGDL
ncbi:hypothetical protein GCM10022222_39690 [Amycolatopsis ultiminotia]|uniref:Uncharacterized protein n=1 Tax=Amycolatopsis ultiminotia TaxID=543629 RepID=A0ABP6WK97_9PSEU